MGGVNQSKNLYLATIRIIFITLQVEAKNFSQSQCQLTIVHCSVRMCIIVQVLIGNREWMKVNNVRVTTKMEQKLQGHEELGHTVALTAVDGN